MRLVRLLIGLQAATLVVAACSDPTPTLPKGPGWQVVAERGNGNWPSLAVRKNSEQDLAVVVIVSGGCPNGGPNTPEFAGFEATPDGLAALVTRAPLPSDGKRCLVASGVEFDVLLDLASVPSTATTIVLGGEACPPGDDFCSAVHAAVPR
jgi:hypothetical protein